MDGEGPAPFAFVLCACWGGAVSHTPAPSILFPFFLSFLFCYLKGVIREFEEYPIFSNFPLDGVARSLSGIREGLMFYSDDLGGPV